MPNYPYDKPNKIPKHTPKTKTVATFVINFLLYYSKSVTPKFSQRISPGSGALETTMIFPLNLLGSWPLITFIT